MADFGTGPGRGRGTGRLIVRTRFVLPDRGLWAGGLGRDVVRADWRRERCLHAATAVLARTRTVEDLLDRAVCYLSAEALTDHPLWDYRSIYASPADGVPGVLDADHRAALVGELHRAERAVWRLSVAVERLRLVCGPAVSGAAYWMSLHAEHAQFAVERCAGYKAAADAVDRLPGDRWQLAAAVRAEVGLPPLAALPAEFYRSTEDDR